MRAMQLDMFGEATPQVAVTCAPSPFAPFPEALLRRLGASLRMLRAAEVMPWPPAEAASRAALFLAAVERLPPDLRGDLAQEFSAEISRLA
jgi:hypothetical protein